LKKNANICSKLLSNDSPQGGTASVIRTQLPGIGGGSPKQLPKGVVLPPPGAYC